MNAYRIGMAIEQFRARMAALGIDVAAIELGDEPSERAVMAALRPACTIPEHSSLGEGVLAHVCGIKIKVSQSSRLHR